MHALGAHPQLHTPIPSIHPPPVASLTIRISTFKSTRSEHSSYVCDLSGQGDHLAKGVVVAGLRLGQLHVGTLETLVEHVHDLGSDVADVRVLFVTLY